MHPLSLLGSVDYPVVVDYFPGRRLHGYHSSIELVGYL
jgi:hypothetical protein